MKAPGERERRLIARLVAALGEYFGRAPQPADRMLAMKLLTTRSGPLAGFRFNTVADVSCLIA